MRWKRTVNWYATMVRRWCPRLLACKYWIYPSMSSTTHPGKRLYLDRHPSTGRGPYGTLWHLVFHAGPTQKDPGTSWSLCNVPGGDFSQTCENVGGSECPTWFDTKSDKCILKASSLVHDACVYLLHEDFNQWCSLELIVLRPPKRHVFYIPWTISMIQNSFKFLWKDYRPKMVACLANGTKEM